LCGGGYLQAYPHIPAWGRVSVGSDSVFAAEDYYRAGEKLSGQTAIETISKAVPSVSTVSLIPPPMVNGTKTVSDVRRKISSMGVSVGSDSVFAAEDYYRAGEKLSGQTAIETISKAYGHHNGLLSIGF
jgi:hypothetical protein